MTKQCGFLEPFSATGRAYLTLQPLCWFEYNRNPNLIAIENNICIGLDTKQRAKSNLLKKSEMISLLPERHLGSEAPTIPYWHTQHQNQHFLNELHQLEPILFAQIWDTQYQLLVSKTEPIFLPPLETGTLVHHS